jgi:hypothetical protein
MTTTSVDEYLDTLQHPRRDDVLRVRAAVLALRPGIEERVKWNAPSFAVDGVDRVTFRLAPGDVFQLVLHRGAARRADTGTFRFADGSGLVRWPAPDRGVVDLTAPGATDEHLDAVLELLGRWLDVDSAPPR